MLLAIGTLGHLLLCSGLLCIWVSGASEDGAGGAGVGGEPVKIFVGERFGGITGCVDDADGAFVLEDRDN